MFVMLRSLDIAVRRGGHIAVTSMQELRHLDMCMFACRTVFTGGCWWTPPALHPTGVLREARIRYSKGALMLRRLDGRVLEACTSRRRLTDDSRGARDVNLRISNTRQIHVSLNKRITACTDAGSILDIVVRERANMNNVNIATAWHRLAKVVQKDSSRSTGGQQAYKLIVNEDIRMGVLERLTKKFANSFDAMNLSNIVWSCAVLNYSHAGYILSCAHKNIRERAHAGLRLPSYPVSDMKTFPSAQALSNCLWSFTTLRHPCAKKFAELVAQVMPKLIHQFDPSAASIGGAFVTQTVTNQLWSFATLRSHPGEDLLDSLADLLAKNCQHFKPQELSNAMWSYAVLTHYPGDEFMHAVETEVSRRIGFFSPQHLANTIFSIAVFRRSDAASRAGLCALLSSLDDDASLRLVNHFNFQDLSHCIWGISVIGGFKLTLYRKLWERCANLSYAATASDKDGMLMIYQGHLLMEAVAPILAKGIPKPIWLLANAKEDWKSQTGEGMISAFQHEVSDHLSDTEIENRLEGKTFDKMLASDVSLTGRGVALECDGPSHFCVNSGTGSVPLSRNGVRDTLLCTRGWQVVSVPWDEWSAQKINGKCRLWVERSLSRLGAQSNTV